MVDCWMMPRLAWFLLFFTHSVVCSEEEQEVVCGVWFAKSTIPGAGLGLFAGKDFSARQSVLPIGDVVIPLIDMEIHHPNKENFLWDEYTWDGASLFMDSEGLNDELHAVSPGFGAAVNCFLDLVNIKETVPVNTNAGLHRSRDPGAGAFSTYWNRDSVASTAIKAGNELFASYGEKWFKSRTDYMGPVPLKGDLELGNTLIQQHAHLESKLGDSKTAKDLAKRVWESFAWKNPWNESSRVLFGLPKNWDEMEKARNITLLSLKRNQHSRSLQWLEEQAICGDWITVKPSTIRQAGRGAFARKTLRKGDIVAPLPLVHLPFRDILDMYEISSETGQFEANPERKNNVQLLTNYCMGHNQSTMLLCPYGTLSNHINHNQTLANVKMVWANPRNSNHDPYWLKKPLKDLWETAYANLAMNLVATRDIQSGDEIFMNYGDEWEQAWQRHVATWQPVKGANDYRSAEQLNLEKVIKTEFELMFSPYPGNVDLKFNLAFDKPRNIWMRHWEEGTLESFMVEEDDYYHECEVLRRSRDGDGHVWYSIVKRSNGDKVKRDKKIENIPAEAFRFFDRPYTSDMHQPNAFRHDIRIPDDLFPEIWKNLKSNSSKKPKTSKSQQSEF